ncbi:7977_t:CDS:2 [Funneliformis mosseae]|uniref:7977_t:CDS:1 n=1 Tax=Funneliformis mosseae TaxID=27381 RepID=A0A9N8ZYY5_FUNMO|nr:7977_t:CDS:2 [Funneliformis mosseae]
MIQDLINLRYNYQAEFENISNNEYAKNPEGLPLRSPNRYRVL